MSSQKLPAPPPPDAKFIEDPLEGEQILLDVMFGGGSTVRPTGVSKPESKPSHYKIVSISLYQEDIQRLNDLVQELRRRGHHKANKSQLIRHALAQVDLDCIPKDV